MDKTLHAANIESNWELIKQLEPYVKSKTSSYAELKAAVEQAIDRYLPELAPAKADIVEYISLYYPGVLRGCWLLVVGCWLLAVSRPSG